ncbi:hypothetical protein HDU91_003314, partial [Kappamyces sp. JEL0680]
FQSKLKKASVSADQIPLAESVNASPAPPSAKSKTQGADQLQVENLETLDEETRTEHQMNGVGSSEPSPAPAAVEDNLTKPPPAPAARQMAAALAPTPTFTPRTLSTENVLAESVRRVGGLIGQTPPEKLQSKTPSSYLKTATEPALAASDSAELPNGLSTFQHKILRGIVEEVIQDFHDQVRLDIQNMHLELLRQFQIQKTDIQELLESHIPAAPILELVERLQLENDRLRRNF